MTEEEYALIENLFKSMYKQLLVCANVRLNNLSLAEEAVQETFEVACTKPSDLRNSSNPEGWLMNALKFVVSTTLRSQSRREKVVVAHLSEERTRNLSTEDEHDVDLLYADLADDPDFKLLKMIAVEKLSMAEAAKQLGIEISTCRKRVERARKRLQKRLNPEGQD